MATLSELTKAPVAALQWAFNTQCARRETQKEEWNNNTPKINDEGFEKISKMESFWYWCKLGVA